MQKRLIHFLLAILFLLPACAENERNTAAAAIVGPVYVFPVKEVVSPTLALFMRRALKDAEAAGASAFILDMDTPGGRTDATEDILAMLHKTKLPTYTFVNPNAASAGALIALGTKKIYMRSDSTIGAAAVVTGEGADLDKTMKTKMDSFLSAKMRAVCVENGHNPDIAEAFMVLEKELKIGDKILDTKDTLLSLNGREATALYDGKPLLAEGLVDSLEELAKQAGLSPTLHRIEPSGFESAAFWLTSFAPLLLMGGIICAWLEFKLPGVIVPGILSVICFALYFSGNFVAGLTGWGTAIVFVIGLCLVIFEFFVAPGVFLPGLLGVLLILGSLIYAMVDHWPGDAPFPTGAALELPMRNLLLALLGTGILAFFLARVLPKTPLFNRLVLTTASASGADITIPASHLTVSLGERGIATTTLRPAGKAKFAEVIHDVVTAGDFIPTGSAVKITSTDGMRIVVEAV